MTRRFIKKAVITLPVEYGEDIGAWLEREYSYQPSSRLVLEIEEEEEIQLCGESNIYSQMLAHTIRDLEWVKS